MAGNKAFKETAAQISETHYEVLAGTIGNNLSYGPYEQGDIIPESGFHGEHDRLLNTIPASIKVATRQVVINEPVTAAPAVDAVTENTNADTTAEAAAGTNGTQE